MGGRQRASSDAIPFSNSLPATLMPCVRNISLKLRNVNGGWPSPLNMNACVPPRSKRGCGEMDRWEAKTHGLCEAALLSICERNVSPETWPR